MTALAKEVSQLVEALPPDKAQALVEFARYLAERADDEEWERKFRDKKYRPKLKALMRQVEREIATGKTKPLDLDQL